MKKDIKDKHIKDQYINAIEKSNIVSKTDIHGIITFVNDEFCELCGYTKEELIGQNHNIIRHEDTPKEAFKKLWNTILSGKVHKGIVKNKAKNGKAFWLNTTIIPIFDEDDNIYEFIAIRHNVTELFLLMEKNRQNEIMIAQQNRLASLGEMLSNIAHQWRQPLNNLSLLGYELKQGNEKAYDEFLKTLNEMSSIIDDFMNFFAPNGKKNEIDFEKLKEKIIKIYQIILEKEGITLSVKNLVKNTLISFENYLLHVIFNIINNAKDAHMQNSLKNKYISIELSEDRYNFYINICDNAGGIDKNIIDKVFEPYFTTKHKGNGAGIGLYMCKQIIDMLNGEIKLKSDLGTTEFKIILRKNNV